jgi:prepilin-type N-terminal cleavage/methylation domain-containing protein
MRQRHRIRGFTMVELMVTIAVIVVLLLIAMPSFLAFRQRAAIRASAEQALGLWQQARFEAAKRNSMVKFGVVPGDDGEFCIGLATTTDKADEVPCDCTQDDECDIARFPADQAEWRGVTLSADDLTLGGDTGVVVIDPKFTALTEIDDAGSFTLVDPPGNKAYLLNMHVDRMGRAFLCESTAAVDHMSDYTNRTCDP